MIRLALIAASLCLLGHTLPALAMFMHVDEPVPVERLVANLERFVEQHPEDPDGHYTLGRVHSLAYAQLAYQAGAPGDPASVSVIPADKRKQLAMNGAHPDLPGFAPYDSVRVGEHEDGPPALSLKARAHLEASLGHYRRAVELAPGNALYALGHGWMLEQAGLYSETARKPEAPAGNEELGDLPATRPAWREQALAAYRKAFELAFEKDKAKEHYLATPDAMVSREAAEGVVRLLELGGIAEGEKQEIESMGRAIAQLEQIPMAVTPVVFSMDASRSWGSLVDRQSRSSFDLAGDGVGREWPWVRGDVGILVWDPERTGRIQSGRQLFGSSTWWMFWDTGYDALAALDDNGDGRLTGLELAGIRVWFDRDGDGASGRGEVVSLASLGIVALRTTGESHSAEDVAAWQPHGIELADGRTLPTWDWRPTSQKPVWECRCAEPPVAAAR